MKSVRILLLVLLLWRSAECYVSDSELTQASKEVTGYSFGALNDMFGQDKAIVSMLEENKNDVTESLGIEHIQENQKQVNSLLSQVEAYWREVCLNFMNYGGHAVPGHVKTQMTNGGCSELFKNINEGVESLQHLKRTTASAIHALGMFKNLKESNVVEFAKSKNEFMMSIIHKRLTVCAFGFEFEGCVLSSEKEN